jgi:hypothetical protein
MHFVYYLLCAATGELLYIGRSHSPKGRKAAFERRTKKNTVFGMQQRHSRLEDACQAELKAIAKHNPPYNLYLASSPARSGKTNSVEHNEAIRRALTGITRSIETRAKISQANKERGPRPQDTEETKKRKSDGKKSRWITYLGETKCLKDWASCSGISRETVAYRLKAGWDLDHVFNSSSK